MKNISLILNIVLALAVAGLYYMEFTDNDENKSETSDSADQMSFDHVSIAYVNSDTLLNQYHFYDELEEKLTNKRTKLEKEFQNRASGLQRQFEDYQKTVNNMTIAQAKAVEEDLGKKQQNLRQYQETLTQELMKEEAKITQDLYNKVAAYLKIYGKEHNLQVVLTYTQGSGVLYANEGLDITADVISGLNQEYDTSLQGNVPTDSTKASK